MLFTYVFPLRHRNSAGETALHLAATQLSLQGLSLLLAGGANANAADDQGRTPLHHACASCHDGTNIDGDDRTGACIALLLSSGALEDACDAYGQTPLHIAAARNNTCAAQALVVAGATEVADAEGNLPLHLAAAQGHVKIIELLVQENRVDSFAAVISSSSVALEDIREEGASLTRTASGWTPFETADGHIYYQNDATGESSWGPPMTPDGRCQASGNASAHAEGLKDCDARANAVAHQNGDPARSCADAMHKEHVGFSGSRRDLSVRCETRAAPIAYGGVTDPPDRSNGKPLPSSFSRHRDDQFREEAGHEGNMISGRSKREVCHRFFENATQGTTEHAEDDLGTMPSTDEDGRHDQQCQDNTHCRPTGKGERRPRRSRRQGESSRFYPKMIAWPQVLSPGEYEKVIIFTQHLRVAFTTDCIEEYVPRQAYLPLKSTHDVVFVGRPGRRGSANIVQSMQLIPLGCLSSPRAPLPCRPGKSV